MCGIVGLLRPGKQIDEHDITAMCDALSHRGPDAQGTWHKQDKALGHRRLAIIAPEQGQQPMSSSDNSVHIVYNGELYNFQELRRELEALGHQFGGKSDTEVVLHAWLAWGIDCLQRFRGMFAFAIIDEKKGEYILARDHLGIKPLYLAQVPGTIAFASELQAIHALKLPLHIDLEAIDDYLAYQYIPSPRSIWQEVRKLPPAHYVRISFAGEIAPFQRYWQPQVHESNQSPNDWLDYIDHTLRESVRAHLVADVPFGAFLSGGIDSSLVAAIMADELGEQVPAFTIGFNDRAFDERAYAEQVAQQCGLQHHISTVEADAVAILPQLVQHYGEPFADDSALPSWYLCQQARQQVPMVLSGDGGDESLAGYQSYAAWQTLLTTPERLSGLKKHLRQGLSRWFPQRWPPEPGAAPTAANWQFLVTIFPPHLRHSLWKPGIRPRIQPSSDAIAKCFAHSQHDDPLKTAQLCDLQTYMPDCVLTKVDRASMAHSLEVRTPMVDIRFVEAALRVPSAVTMQQQAGQWSGKQPLKQLAERRFGAAFANRPKQGFAAPSSRWLGPGGALHDDFRRRCSDGPLLHLFSPTALSQFQQDSGHRRAWALLILDEWLRQNPCDLPS